MKRDVTTTDSCILNILSITINYHKNKNYTRDERLKDYKYYEKLMALSISFDKINIVKYLVDKYQFVYNQRVMYAYCIVYNKLECFKFFWFLNLDRNTYRQGWMQLCIDRNAIDVFIFLQAQHLNCPQLSPLVAIKKNNLQIIEYLLSFKLINVSYNNEEALHAAIESRNVDMVKLLCKYTK
jgi:hypothetical protein